MNILLAYNDTDASGGRSSVPPSSRAYAAPSSS
jgi:hypothetical protein